MPFLPVTVLDVEWMCRVVGQRSGEWYLAVALFLGFLGFLMAPLGLLGQSAAPEYHPNTRAELLMAPAACVGPGATRRLLLQFKWHWSPSSHLSACTTTREKGGRGARKSTRVKAQGHE